MFYPILMCDSFNITNFAVLRIYMCESFVHFTRHGFTHGVITASRFTYACGISYIICKHITCAHSMANNNVWSS